MRPKNDTSLVDLVITDNYIIGKAIQNILKRIDQGNNWVVVSCPKALEFIKKNDGYTDEFKPLYKVTSKEMDFNANKAKTIWIATVPDNRGDYLSYKFQEHIRKDLKVNCPIYRMRLYSITEDCILNSLFNKKNIAVDKEVILRYESYAVLDHAVSVNVSRLLAEKFPFNFDIYFHTGIILDFIDKLQLNYLVKRKGLYSVISLYDKETFVHSTVTSKIVDKKKIKNVVSLEDLYVLMSGFTSWYGFHSSLCEAYSTGSITYPTNDITHKAPTALNIRDSKQSKTDWGLVWLKDAQSNEDTIRYLLSEVHFVNTNGAIRYEVEHISENDKFFIHSYHVGNKQSALQGNAIKLHRGRYIGVAQRDLLYCFKYLGFSVKLIPWIMNSMIKSGLIVYTTPTTVTLTSLGKFVLMILRNNVQILLNKKYIRNTLSGIKDLTLKDELKNYEFMQERIDKFKCLTENAYENLVVPKCSDKCSCGKRYSITISNRSVFATCTNNECAYAGEAFPINIEDDKIEVIKDDQLRKSKNVLKHGSKKSRTGTDKHS